MDFEEQEGDFITHDNSTFYYRGWLPSDPKFLVLYLHGAAAHSGEATFLAEHLTGIGGATYAFDQRGWGRTAKRKAGHINNGKNVIADVMSFLEFIQTKHPALPVVLVGHSMGGLIAGRTLIDHQDEFTCAVLSSPWIDTRSRIPFYVKLLGGIISKIWPTFADDLDIKIDELTHDNGVINRYYDEIEEGIRKTHGTARWFSEMKKFQATVKEEGHLIQLPVLVMQAGQDLLVSEAASKDFYNSISSEKKKWQYYPNLYHEVMNEVKEDRENTIQEATDFISGIIKQV